jgi:hypothetical protein
LTHGIFGAVILKAVYRSRMSVVQQHRCLLMAQKAHVLGDLLRCICRDRIRRQQATQDVAFVFLVPSIVVVNTYACLHGDGSKPQAFMHALKQLPGQLVA